ncbi:hypothetical protein EVAR_17204_1 [Eumeta japonica]|uniref:Uncharacterized protein n=1 Tax=Eumeta variegata TaxID=151549 RepID=A0A4C1U9S2_EUMVA|nr:hypothetical protein EVAR_17204_1 [Eumeta japonica]
MLQNLENEEDYEVINTVQIEQLHDWMEVAAGPQNINQEDDLAIRSISHTTDIPVPKAPAILAGILSPDEDGVVPEPDDGSSSEF